jgi:hypothetical protein
MADRCLVEPANNDNDRNKLAVCEGHTTGTSGEKGTDLARDIGIIALLPIFDVEHSNILLKGGAIPLAAHHCRTWAH